MDRVFYSEKKSLLLIYDFCLQWSLIIFEFVFKNTNLKYLFFGVSYTIVRKYVFLIRYI